MKSCEHLLNLNHLILSLTVSQIYLKSISHSKKAAESQWLWTAEVSVVVKDWKFLPT